MGKIYTTAQIAKKIGVHKNTIFYWLKMGKIKEPKRDPVFNARLWTEDDLENLSKIKIRR